jgi:hypothetical protein
MWRRRSGSSGLSGLGSSEERPLVSVVGIAEMKGRPEGESSRRLGILFVHRGR